MELPILIVTIILTYYTIYCGRILLSNKHRNLVVSTNQRLDKLRKKPVKTFEEQREFINLKYPKGQFRKFSWKRFGISFLVFLPTIFLYVLVFRSYIYLWQWLNWNVKFWQALLFIFVFPFVINYLLSKFKLQKTDLSVFLRWK